MIVRAYRESDWRHICDIYDLAKPDELVGVVAPECIPPLEADVEMKELFATSKIVVAEVNAKVSSCITLRRGLPQMPRRSPGPHCLRIIRSLVPGKSRYRVPSAMRSPHL